MQPKGDVWFLTYTLTFPRDRDQWVKQEPFTGDPRRWIDKFLHLSDLQKLTLLKNKKISWTDQNGVWIELQILDHQVPTKWGSHASISK